MNKQFENVKVFQDEVILKPFTDRKYDGNFAEYKTCKLW